MILLVNGIGLISNHQTNPQPGALLVFKVAFERRSSFLQSVFCFDALLFLPRLVSLFIFVLLSLCCRLYSTKK